MQRFQNNLLDDKKNFAIDIVCGSPEQGNMACGHCHTFYEIYVQTDGRRRYFLKNSIYEIEAGDVVLIAPSVVHKTSDIDKKPYSRLLVEFDDQYINDMVNLLGDKEVRKRFFELLTNGYYIYRNTEKKDTILGACKNISVENESTYSFDHLKCKLMVAELILNILQDAYGACPANEIDNRHKITQILHYINNNYDKELSLKEISARFYISYYHLSRLFKEVTGFTFVAYMNIIRVNKARLLMEATEDRLETISKIVGFGSQKQFVRAFKSLHGISPSKYRATQRQQKH